MPKPKYLVATPYKHSGYGPLSLLLLFCCLQGCAGLKQEQYFAVVGEPDPVTGVAQKSYYRLTVESSGYLLANYKLAAAYVSSSTLDTLNGKLPVIPEADLPKANEVAFDKIKDSYLTRLQENATSAAAQDVTRVAPADYRYFENSLVKVARDAWYSTLSDQDLISLGQVESANPFQFRKLVFVASETNINVEDYDKQINSVVEKTSTLARYLKGTTQPSTTLPSEEFKPTSDNSNDDATPLPSAPPGPPATHQSHH